MDIQPIQPPSTKNSWFSNLSASALFIFDFLKVIIIALAIILPIRYFIFQPFIVSGHSMEPNYFEGEYLVIDEISYRTREPARGEVVVLKYPEDRSQYFIKRIIALPHERVSVDNGRVTIFNDEYPDGKVLEEEYLTNQELSFPHDSSILGGKKTLTLKENEYFMMGDNRINSSDSRDWGPLNRSDMVGKVYLRALPLSKFDKFETPNYSF